MHVHVHAHVHCIVLHYMYTSPVTCSTCTCMYSNTQYLGQFIGECDEEFAISLSLVWRESENTCHIVTLWTLLLLRGREGGREGGREDGYVGRQTWICTIPGLYMHDERERLLLATWPVVLNGRV